MVRLSFEHLSGSRRGRGEAFDLEPGGEVSFGREAACDVRYAEDDEYVSRRHIRIVLVSVAGPELVLYDLGSSNGTFVNNQRVFSPLKIRAGDVIRLGAGGPELKLEVPAVEGEAARPQRAAANPPARAEAAEPKKLPSRRRRKTAFVLAATVLGAVVVGAAFHYAPEAKAFAGGINLQPVKARAAAYVESFRSRLRTEAGRTNLPGAEAIVLVEWRWNLVEEDSGRPLYYLAAANRQDGAAPGPLVAGAGDLLPVFALTDGKVEPVVATSDGQGHNRPIAGAARTCGFFANSQGAVLTVADPAGQAGRAHSWDEPAGILLLSGDGRGGRERAAIIRQLFPRWAPAASNAAILGDLNIASGAVSLRGRLRGRLSISRPLVPGRENDAVRTSFTAGPSGLATFRIASDKPLPALPVEDENAPAGAGEEVTVLGYASDSPKAVRVSTTVVRPLAGDEFELASRPVALYPGAAVLGQAGKVIGILQPRAGRWFAIAARQARKVLEDGS